MLRDEAKLWDLTHSILIEWIIEGGKSLPNIERYIVNQE
jgi:hypothetical protein